MTWLDWIVVAMFIYFVIQGLFKGAAISALGALALTIAYLIAAIALPSMGAVAADMSLMPRDLSLEWRHAVAFIATFIFVYILLLLLMSILLPGAKRPGMQAQVLGIVFGAMKAFVAAMILVAVLLASPLGDAIAQDTQRSPIVRYIADVQRSYVRTLQGLSPIKFPPVGPDAKF
jgi:uncharacterized membrane protein required for colicin V production